MTLLAPWFLAGLLALAPLLALHLRRRRRRQEVASLLLWRELPSAAPGRRRAQLVPSLALLLQALIVVLLVLALARPAGDGDAGGAGAAPQVFVVDGSRAMAATDVAPDRLAQARRTLDQRLARLGSETPVSVIVAGTAPGLLASGVSPGAARDALANLRATAPTADLRAGLALAAGQLHRTGGTVTLLHAIEHAPPRVETDGVAFAAEAIGTRVDDQRLEQPVARCAPADATTAAAEAAPICTVFAAVRNDGEAAVRERLVVERDGDESASRALSLAPGERVEITFPAEAGARLTVRLDGAGDAADPPAGAEPAADPASATGQSATVVVPDPAAPTSVTLVSDRAADAPLARALAATPGVTLRLVAPDAFDADDAGKPDLLVLDRWLAEGELPSARTLLLVAPPRLPGGAIGRPLAEPVPSGAAADPLLNGVDLDALAIDAGAARATTLPLALHALAWTPDGPLVAAGTLPGERPAQIALLTFDPQASNLPQLPAFPILLGNVVAWAGAAAANAANSGAHDADPGAHDADPGADDADPGADDAVVLRASDGGGVLPGPPREWWPWLVAAGLLLLLAEWSYPRWSGRRKVAR